MKNFIKLIPDAGRSLAMALVTAVLLVGLGVLLAPMAAKVWRDTELRISRALYDTSGQSGLIYVESPEVYTRQRLVNDRYLQDAWLRDRLKEIDDYPDAGWIDTIEVERRLARLSLTARTAPEVAGTDGDRDEAENAPAENAALSDDLLALAAALPFETRFRLQSQARDKIRQQILENALDDRHDLSGNTVFGLKFDTSILPGSATRLSPTVAVQMARNPLDRLLEPARDGDPRRAPEEFVRFFTRFASTDGWEGMSEEDYEILVGFDRHFDDWRHNVERRLEEHRDDAEARQQGTWARRTLAQCPAAISEAVLCRGTDLAPVAEEALRALFSPVSSLDESLEFVTRLSGADMRLGSKFRARMIENARDSCTDDREDDASDGGFVAASDEAPRTVKDYLLEEERTFQILSLPGTWGQFFDVQPEYRISDAAGVCTFELDLSLVERDITVYLMDSEGDRNPVPARAALSPIHADVLHGDPSRAEAASVWVDQTDRSTLDQLQSALNPRTLEQLREAVSGRLDEVSQCYAQPPDGATGFMFEARDGAADAAGAFAEMGFEVDCVPGRAIGLRLGAFEFFRRMTEVESYAYAAFPRGDVSGVVTEAGTDRRLDAELSAPLGEGTFGLGREQLSRRVTTRPSLINFSSGQSRAYVSSGDSPELFDFGWTIVKDGPKEPMMASQLVLLSVPAYLDEISLTLWKGFMDVDQAPVDRGDFNDLDIRERIERLMPSWEERTITLNVPPDFAALDSIVIGRNEIFGPKINEPEMQKRCHSIAPDGSLALVIPGERLWRSTVVTLDGRKADQIEVMPDMRGILATFRPAERQSSCSGTDAQPCEPEQPTPIFAAVSGADGKTVSRELIVWTSESNDEVDIEMCVPGVSVSRERLSRDVRASGAAEDAGAERAAIIDD